MTKKLTQKIKLKIVLRALVEFTAEIKQAKLEIVIKRDKSVWIGAVIGAFAAICPRIKGIPVEKCSIFV